MGKIFFKNVQGKRSQPYTIDDLKTRGNLYSDDLIWHEGLDGWTKASKIKELKEFAISKPPLTDSEINKISLIKAIKPTIVFYIITSIIIGITGALIEKNKYDSFINSITKTQYNTTSNYNINNNNDDKIKLTEYSDVKHSDVYAQKKDGNGYYTRWKVYATVGNQDNSEQRSYEETYKLLFRPYKTFYEIVNLSNEEINSTNILLFNFIYSAFATNFLFLPIIFLMLFIVIRRKTNQHNYSIEQNKKYLPLILGGIILIGIIILSTSRKSYSNNSITEEDNTNATTQTTDTNVILDSVKSAIKSDDVSIDTTTAIAVKENISTPKIENSYFFGAWRGVTSEFTFYSNGDVNIKFKDGSDEWKKWKFEENILYIGNNTIQKVYIIDIETNSFGWKLDGYNETVHLYRVIN